MTILEHVKKWLREADSNEPVEAPTDFCPNCWGRQEYGGNYYEAIKNKGVSINNIDDNRGWIQKYVDENLNGIKLQHYDDENVICNACKVKYKKV